MSGSHRLLVFFLLLSTTTALRAQQVRFIPVWGEYPITRDSLNLEGWRFTDVRSYISDFRIESGATVFWQDTLPARLIDWLNPDANSFTYRLAQKSDSMRLCFSLGLDSALNCNGIRNGVLDPVNGMYWTWQSGFIHLRIEAISPEGKSIEAHLGGYRAPYATYNRGCFSSPQPVEELTVLFDLKPVMTAMISDKTSHIMSPGAKAQQYFRIAAMGLSLVQKK